MTAPTDRDRATAVPVWVPVAGGLLALLGLALSVYLTVEHFTDSTGTALACPGTGAIDCAKVTTSPQSELFGIFPVAVLGLAYFVVALPAQATWRRPEPLFWTARLALAGLGIAFVLYLVYVELFDVGALCLWCTGVHVVTFLLFVVTLLGTTYRPR